MCALMQSSLFEVAYKLKMNLETSKVMAVGQVSSLGEIVEIMGYEIGELPSYLSLPLGERHASVRI